MKKYYILIAAIIVLAIIGAGLYLSRPKKNINITPAQVQSDILSQFSDSKGHKVEIKSASGTLSGELNATSFKGNFKSSKNFASRTIISVSGKNYVNDNKGQISEEDSAGFASQINIITHPDWIQIQRQVADFSYDGKKYLRYEILFENPNQEITKTLSQEVHDKIGYFGYILVDRNSREIRQLKIHVGKAIPKDTSAEITVDFAALSNPPIIKAPK